MNNDTRMQELSTWLRELFDDFTVTFLAHDAGFRRYFRVHAQNKTWVVMDAPPQLEDCQPFLKVAAMLAQANLCVPHCFAKDLSRGFLLLTDLGDARFDRLLTMDNRDVLYGAALEVIPVIQRCDVSAFTAPVLDREFMLKELDDFRLWYVEAHLNYVMNSTERKLFNKGCEVLVETLAQQAYTTIHRDFHSRNLMWFEQQVGVLDFQNLMRGPVTYDCVSLLKDCYMIWPEEKAKKREKIENLALTFRESLQQEVAPEQFLRDFDWMGVQRHLKAIMTFSRKYQRDKEDGYLKYILPTQQAVMSVVERYSELSEFSVLLQRWVPELMSL